MALMIMRAQGHIVTSLLYEDRGPLLPGYSFLSNPPPLLVPPLTRFAANEYNIGFCKEIRIFIYIYIYE